MKKWELHQVKIDRFVANEYVSSCQDDNTNIHRQIRNLAKTSTCDTDGYANQYWGGPSHMLVAGISGVSEKFQNDINNGVYHGQYVWINIGGTNDAAARRLGITEIVVESSSQHWAKVYGYATTVNEAYRLSLNTPVVRS